MLPPSLSRPGRTSKQKRSKGLVRPNDAPGSKSALSGPSLHRRAVLRFSRGSDNSPGSRERDIDTSRVAALRQLRTQRYLADAHGAGTVGGGTLYALLGTLLEHQREKRVRDDPKDQEGRRALFLGSRRIHNLSRSTNPPPPQTAVNDSASSP